MTLLYVIHLVKDDGRKIIMAEWATLAAALEDLKRWRESKHEVFVISTVKVERAALEQIFGLH